MDEVWEQVEVKWRGEMSESLWLRRTALPHEYEMPDGELMYIPPDNLLWMKVRKRSSTRPKPLGGGTGWSYTNIA